MQAVCPFWINWRIEEKSLAIYQRTAQGFALIMNASVAETAKNLEAFLDRFEVFKQQENRILSGIQLFLDRFKNARPKLQCDERDWETQTAPHFNIFRVLNIQRREVKLHSRFIAGLLDPRGLHSRQDYFLNLFFEATGLRRPKDQPRLSDWKVTIEEVAMDLGRLDIVLRAPGFIVAIENKIDAGEQEDQLDRYGKWLAKQKNKFRDQQLIFLTPDGRLPVTDVEKQCVCLSYCEHIQNWLKLALQFRQAPLIESAIEQYLQVVKSLRS